MSADDRILRLENAMATLAELAADQERRTARLEESTAHLQESTARLEESFVLLVALIRRHDERLDEARAAQDKLGGAQNELRAAQVESEHKIAALADAHIRTEEALANLTGKVDTLIDIVQGGLNGRSSVLPGASFLV